MVVHDGGPTRRRRTRLGLQRAVVALTVLLKGGQAAFHSSGAPSVFGTTGVAVAERRVSHPPGVVYASPSASHSSGPFNSKSQLIQDLSFVYSSYPPATAPPPPPPPSQLLELAENLDGAGTLDAQACCLLIHRLSRSRRLQSDPMVMEDDPRYVWLLDRTRQGLLMQLPAVDCASLVGALRGLAEMRGAGTRQVPGFWQVMLGAVEAGVESHHFSFEAVVSALESLARLDLLGFFHNEPMLESVLDQILREIDRRLDEASPQSQALIMALLCHFHKTRRLPLNPRDRQIFLRSVAGRALIQLSLFTPSELSLVVEAFGYLRYTPPGPFLQELHDYLVTRLDQFSLSDLASLVSGLSRYYRQEESEENLRKRRRMQRRRHLSPPVLKSLLKQITAVCSSSSKLGSISQEQRKSRPPPVTMVTLTRLLKSITALTEDGDITSGQYVMPCIQAIIKAATTSLLSHPANQKPEESLGTLPVSGPVLTDFLAHLARHHRGNPPPAAFFDAWLTRSSMCLSTFRPHEVSSSLQALARLRPPLGNPNLKSFLSDMILTASLTHPDGFTSCQLAQAMEGLARLGFHDDPSPREKEAFRSVLRQVHHEANLMEPRAVVQALRGLQPVVVRGGQDEEWYREVIEGLLSRVDHFLLQRNLPHGLGLLGLSSVIQSLGHLSHYPQDPSIVDRLALAFATRLDALTSAGLPSNHRLISQGTLAKSVAQALYGLVSLGWWPSLEVARPFFHRLRAAFETAPTTTPRRVTALLSAEEDEEKVEDLWDRAGLYDLKKKEGDQQKAKSASPFEMLDEEEDEDMQDGWNDVWSRAGWVGLSEKEREPQDDPKKQQGRLADFFPTRNSLFATGAPVQATEEAEAPTSPAAAPIPFLRRMNTESLVRTLWSLCAWAAMAPPTHDLEDDLGLLPLMRGVQHQLSHRLLAGSKGELPLEARTLLLQASAFLHHHCANTKDEEDSYRKEEMELLSRAITYALPRNMTGDLAIHPPVPEVARVVSVLQDELRIDPSLIVTGPVSSSLEAGAVPLDLVVRMPSSPRVVALDLTVPSRTLWSGVSGRKQRINGDVAFRRYLLGLTQAEKGSVGVRADGLGQKGKEVMAVPVVVDATATSKTMAKQLSILTKEDEGRVNPQNGGGSNWEKMTVIQLRQVLKAQGLTTAGNKAQLIQRVAQVTGGGRSRATTTTTTHTEEAGMA